MFIKLKTTRLNELTNTDIRRCGCRHVNIARTEQQPNLQQKNIKRFKLLRMALPDQTARVLEHHATPLYIISQKTSSNNDNDDDIYAIEFESCVFVYFDVSRGAAFGAASLPIDILSLFSFF